MGGSAFFMHFVLKWRVEENRMDEKLKSLYMWFDIKRDEIITGHEKERVLISENKVLGYFPTEKDAVENAKKLGLKLGNFLVQRCITQADEMNMFANVGALYAL